MSQGSQSELIKIQWIVSRSMCIMTVLLCMLSQLCKYGLKLIFIDLSSFWRDFLVEQGLHHSEIINTLVGKFRPNLKCIAIK